MTSTRDSTIQNFRRYEFKYIVNNSSAELIRQDLLEFLELDPLLKQSGDKSYTVRSLYFDNNFRKDNLPTFLVLSYLCCNGMPKA